MVVLGAVSRRVTWRCSEMYGVRLELRSVEKVGVFLGELVR